MHHEKSLETGALEQATNYQTASLKDGEDQVADAVLPYE